MKTYCLDTSGLSNPLETMPEDIHRTLWASIAQVIRDGKFAVNAEIFEELTYLPGPIGMCINDNCHVLRLEVGEATWDWASYRVHTNDLLRRYRRVISEYNGNRKGTVGVTDISIVALAKTLGLPVISMEAMSFQVSDRRMRIPQVCQAESVIHLTFNEFLRAEGISN